MEFGTPPDSKNDLGHFSTPILEGQEVEVLSAAASVWLEGRRMPSETDEHADEYSVCQRLASLRPRDGVEIRASRESHGLITEVLDGYAAAIERAGQIANLHDITLDPAFVRNGQMARTMYDRIVLEEKVLEFSAELPTFPDGE